MVVYELMNILKQCNPNATVCVTAEMDNEASTVYQYDDEYDGTVYIADRMDFVDYDLQDQGYKLKKRFNKKGEQI